MMQYFIYDDPPVDYQPQCKPTGIPSEENYELPELFQNLLTIERLDFHTICCQTTLKI